MLRKWRSRQEGEGRGWWENFYVSSFCLANYHLHRGQDAPLVWLALKYLQELIIDTPPSLLIFPTEPKHKGDKWHFKLTRQTSSLPLKSSKSELTSPINSRIESHKLNIRRTSPLLKWCFHALMDLAVAGSQRKAVLTKSLTDYAFFPLFIQDRFIIPICQAGGVPINYTRPSSARDLPMSDLI